MAYDFTTIGKRTVLNQLVKDIKGKADYLQSSNLTKTQKCTVLKDLEVLSKDAYNILKDL